jgi:enoyl-CoA hydratase/carnithine racemase
VLRGAGGAFAGGTDINHLRDISTGEDGVVYEARMGTVQQRMLDLRVPLIAAVEGPCVGGGLVLAALSDLVVCTPSARFGSPIARTVGNTLSAGSLARLQQTLGRRRTAEVLLTGRLLSAEEAYAAGFVTALVEPDQLEEHLAQLLEAIRGCAPLTLRSFKEFERRIDAALAGVEVDDVYREIYGSRDFHEGVDAFLSRRPPWFEGR